MADLKEVFEMATTQIDPDQDSWKEQERRQRRAARNRKLGAFAAVAVILIGVAAFFLALRPTHAGQPAHQVSPTTIGTRQTAEIVGLDGAVQHTIDGLPLAAYGLAVSPDGSQVAFAAGPFTEARIGVVALDGSNERWLTAKDVNADMPAWSPDGSRIAFVANGTNPATNARDLFVVGADGSGLRQLTHGAGGEDQPSWSPDGSTIVYRNGTGGEFSKNQEIWTIPAQGGTPIQLTHDRVSDEEPAFSPTAQKIAYVHGTDLWVMNSNGTQPHQIAKDGFAPHWSPDGARIVALRYEEANGVVSNLQFRGAGQHPILDVIIVTPAGGVSLVPSAKVAGDLSTVTWMPTAYGDALVLNNVHGR